MKITDRKIERVCNLRYNAVKVIPIALNERLSEKTVRTILKQNYPAYLKMLKTSQSGYTPWGNSLLKEKTVTETEMKYDGGYTYQDANCRIPEYQRLLEKINEQDKTIKVYKENDRTKDLQLQQNKEDIDAVLKKIQSLTQIVKDHEQKDKVYEAEIQNKDHYIQYLENLDSDGIQGIQHDISDIKKKLNTGVTEVQKGFGTLTEYSNQLILFFNKYDTIKDEKNKFEVELQALKAQHKNDWIIYSSIAGVSFSVGTLFGRYIIPSRSESSTAWIFELIKNIVTGYNTHAHAIVHSGLNLEKNTYSTLCSGGYNPIPNQQQNTIQPDLYSGVNLVTNPSVYQGSGPFYTSHAENVPRQGHPLTQNPLPSLIPLHSYIPYTPSDDPPDAHLW